MQKLGNGIRRRILVFANKYVMVAVSVQWPLQKNTVLSLLIFAAFLVNVSMLTTSPARQSLPMAEVITDSNDTFYIIPPQRNSVAHEFKHVVKARPITDFITDPKVLEFITHNQVLQRAYEAQKSTGLSVATIIAQKGVESNWGQSSLTQKTRNLGNIKCKCNWNASLRKQHSSANVCRRAWDKKEKSNHYYVVLDSNWQGWNFYAQLIKKRYKRAARKGDVLAEIQELKRLGYASDKNYVSTLWGVVQKYNLIELNKAINEGYLITSETGVYSYLKR